MREKYYIAIIESLNNDLEFEKAKVVTLIGEKNDLINSRDTWVRFYNEKATELEQATKQLAEASNFKTVSEAAKA